MSTLPSTVLRRWHAARDRDLPNRDLLSLHPAVRDELLDVWWSEKHRDDARSR